jgi:hypothetical protein
MRFDTKIFQSGPLECWEWAGARLPTGYGQFFIDGHVRRAHRIAFERERGSIPQGMVLDHVCRNPPCVNPYHLDIVTQRENILRGEAPAAKNARAKMCIRGHDLTDTAITYNSPSGRRSCRLCRRLFDKRRYLSKKGKNNAHS